MAATAQTLNILSPTNQATYLAPGSFTVLADAESFAGTVTNVDFFNFLTNKIGTTTNVAPYPHFYCVLTNQLTNDYSISAQATDDAGTMSTSSPVVVHFIDQPLVSTGKLVLNVGDGLFWLTNVVSNPTYLIFTSVRVKIYGITNPISVVNASGINNGIPYVQSTNAIQSGSAWTNIVKFYDPLGTQFHPLLQAELLSFSNVPPQISRGAQTNEAFLLEFSSSSNRVYLIQSSSNLLDWAAAGVGLTGNGSTVQWEDPNPSDPLRFYRAVELP